MNSKNSIKVAIVQERPAFFDLEACMTKLKGIIESAGQKETDLLVFGETWLSGYPAWLDYLPNIALWGHEPTKQAFALMHENAVVVPGPETDLIGQLAAKYKMIITIGVNEKVDHGPGQGTIYNGLLTFDQSGNLANHHRKLMPTYTEKLLYGLGDGAGLRTIESPFGKIGGLICWEHWMPLARQSMHDQGESLHVAVWPTVHDVHQLASRHYAFEGRCFVVAAGQILQFKDLPAFLKNGHSNDPDQYLLRGGSCVIAPDGQFLLLPVFEREETLHLEIPDLKQSLREKMTLDVTGHYQRTDIFDFKVQRHRKT